MSEARPSSADVAVLHLVAWFCHRSWVERPNDALMLDALAEVLPKANRALPQIAAFAAQGERILARRGNERALTAEGVEARVLCAQFHGRRGLEALDVFRKGAANV